MTGTITLLKNGHEMRTAYFSSKKQRRELSKEWAKLKIQLIYLFNMSTKEAIKEISDYLDIELSEYDRKRLDRILQKIVVKTEVVAKETVFIEVGNKISVSEINLNDYAERAIIKYGITPAMFYGADRHLNCVCARVHFVRSVIYACYNYPQLWLAHHLKKDHATIAHYLYHVKKPCEFPPLKNLLKNNLISL